MKKLLLLSIAIFNISNMWAFNVSVQNKTGKNAKCYLVFYTLKDGKPTNKESTTSPQTIPKYTSTTLPTKLQSTITPSSTRPCQLDCIISTKMYGTILLESKDNNKTCTITTQTNGNLLFSLK